MNLVDVVIPMRNGASTVLATLDSVLAQTHVPDHVFVIDDGSTDSGGEMVRARRLPTVIVIETPAHGVSHARNVGISHSRAAFIAFLDCDDLWAKEKLEQQLKVVQNHRQVAVVTCGSLSLDMAHRPIAGTHYCPNLRGHVFNKIFRQGFIRGGISSNMLVRRDALLRVGGFDERMSIGEDIDLWLRLARHYVFDYCRAPLVHIVENQLSTTRRRGSPAQRQEALLQPLGCLDRWITAGASTGWMLVFGARLILTHIIRERLTALEVWGLREAIMARAPKIGRRLARSRTRLIAAAIIAGLVYFPGAWRAWTLRRRRLAANWNPTNTHDVCTQSFMNVPESRAAARPHGRVAALRFNVVFWLGFWLSPVVVQIMEQWPEVSPLQCLLWLKQGVVFTAGLAALAEAFGRKRRLFYLLVGLLAWGGAIIATVFLATTGITANAFTALTGIVYSGHDGAGLRYLLFMPQDLVGVLTATCPFLLLIFRWRKLNWPTSLPAFAMATSLCVLITGGYWIWHDYGTHGGMDDNRLDSLGKVLDPAPPVAAYVSLSRALPLARQMMLKPGRSPPAIQSSTPQRPLTIIVVVGESTTRNHMGLYGYCRNTTPLLGQRSADLFVFRNTISETPMTVFALSNGLRVALDNTHGHPDQSVFDIFNAASFHTYWLSNQFDYPGDPVSALTQRAEHRIFTYRGKKNYANSASLDGTLIPPLKGILSSDPASKIVFLHTVGTHSFYEERVPPGFLAHAFESVPLNRSVQQTKVIDDYDKAVGYVDHIVDQVISLSLGQADMAVVYFSDHGDEVFDSIDFVGHRYPRATHGMVEIPLLVWLSPQLRAARPALVAALNAAVSRLMDIRDISPLLLDVAGISVAGLSDQRRPLASSFLPQRRLVAAEDYDQDTKLGISERLAPIACAAAMSAAAPRDERSVRAMSASGDIVAN